MLEGFISTEVSCYIHCSLLLFGSWDFPVGSTVKNLPANAGDISFITGQEDPLEKETATPLQYSCLGTPKRVRHDSVSKPSPPLQNYGSTLSNLLVYYKYTHRHQ